MLFTGFAWAVNAQLDEMRKEMSELMAQAGEGEIGGRQAAQQMCDVLRPLIDKK